MPRIPYVDVSTLPPQQQSFLKKLSPNKDDQKQGKTLNIFRAMAHSYASLQGTVRMGNAILMQGKLCPKLRELAIVRVGRLSKAPYEVFQHERIGLQVGIPKEQIAALRDNNINSSVFDDKEKAVLRFTDDIVYNVKASDENLNKVKAHLDAQEIVELIIAIGYYMLISRFLETFGVDGEEGQEKWRASSKM